MNFAGKYTTRNKQQISKETKPFNQTHLKSIKILFNRKIIKIISHSGGKHPNFKPSNWKILKRIFKKIIIKDCNLINDCFWLLVLENHLSEETKIQDSVYTIFSTVRSR